MKTSTICIGFLMVLTFSVSGGVALAKETNKLHAMVIGNGDYKVGKLTNPANDAKAISDALSELGFQVTTETNLTHQNMDQSITKFCQGVDEGGLAFFFFAGHGIQVDGENYLIPVDAEIPDQTYVKYKAVSLSLILDTLGKSRSNMNVVVLDCCRNNPFERSWSTRSLGNRGLAAQTSIPEGTIIAYATSPGKTAADGDGGNSPYTTELAAALKQRPQNGLLLRDVFFTASRAVKEKTGQSPWVNMEASLDNFYLRPSEIVATASVPRPEPELDLQTQQMASVISTAEKLDLTADPIEQPLGLEVKSLFDQAEVYLRQGQYDNAIMAYTAILESSTLPTSARQKARKSRGAAYLGRGSKKDLNCAIIDQLAAGLDGIRVTVRTESADLQVGTKKSGHVSRGQVLRVTKAMEHNQSDWFWVAAVNGDETLKGWVTSATVVKSGEVSKPTSTTLPAIPSHPASSNVVIQKPVPAAVPNSFVQPQHHTQSFSQHQHPVTHSGNSTTQSSQFSRPQQQSSHWTNGHSNNSWNNGHAQSGWQHKQSNTWNNNHGHNNWQNNQWKGNNRNNSGAKSIWATPKWESPAEIRRGIANGTLRW